MYSYGWTLYVVHLFWTRGIRHCMPLTVVVFHVSVQLTSFLAVTRIIVLSFDGRGRGTP
jgi:hypothetical protein